MCLYLCVCVRAGEAASFVEHIELGIREADQDPDAMLLFSGGQTRLAAGPRSEGLSYWVVAEAAGWFNTTSVRGRTFTEEHARDSFENLLFSLCRWVAQGHTVESYTLKYGWETQAWEQIDKHWAQRKDGGTAARV